MVQGLTFACYRLNLCFLRLKIQRFELLSVQGFMVKRFIGLNCVLQQLRLKVQNIRFEILRSDSRL